MWTLGDKYNKMTPEKAGRIVMERLAEYEPFVFHRSACRASVYIHFNNLPNKLTHKLRVSDHPERERYGYKWGLRLDNRRITRKEGKLQYFFHDIDSLVTSFKRYYDRVQSLNNELLSAAGELDFDGLSLSRTSTTIEQDF